MRHLLPRASARCGRAGRILIVDVGAGSGDVARPARVERCARRADARRGRRASTSSGGTSPRAARMVARRRARRRRSPADAFRLPLRRRAPSTSPSRRCSSTTSRPRRIAGILARALARRAARVRGARPAAPPRAVGSSSRSRAAPLPRADLRARTASRRCGRPTRRRRRSSIARPRSRPGRRARRVFPFRCLLDGARRVTRGPEACDAIVVGAGPAGSAAAAVLAARGRRVLLLEKDRFPRRKVCGEFLSATRARRASSGSASATEVEAIAETIDRGSAPPAEGRGRRVSRCPAPALGISRYALDDLLAARAAELGAERALRSARRRDRGRATAAASAFAGSARTAASGRRRRGRGVIGAWGRWDALDRALDAPVRARERGALLRAGAATTARASARSPARSACTSFPGGYCGLSRVEGGAVNLAGVISERPTRGGSRRDGTASSRTPGASNAGARPRPRRPRRSGPTDSSEPARSSSPRKPPADGGT